MQRPERQARSSRHGTDGKTGVQGVKRPSQHHRFEFIDCHESPRVTRTMNPAQILGNLYISRHGYTATLRP